MSERREWEPEEKYVDIVESNHYISSMEGFGEKEAIFLSSYLQKFVIDYSNRKNDNWLIESLQDKFPDKKLVEIQGLSKEIRNCVLHWNSNVESINLACAEGTSKEEWLEKILRENVTNSNSDYNKESIIFLLNNLHKENENVLQSFGIVHTGENLPFNDSNTVNEMILKLVKEIEVSGIAGTFIDTGLRLAEKSIFSDKIWEFNEIAECLRNGNDSEIKEIATAALKVAVEEGNVVILPRNTPIEIISGIACFGVEQTKIILQFADGKISSTKALELIGRATIVNASLVLNKLGENIGRKIGQKVGITIGMIFPLLAPVGAVIGSFIGSTIGRMGGSIVGKVINKAAKKLSDIAKPLLNQIWNGVKSVARGIKQIISIFDTTKA